MKESQKEKVESLIKQVIGLEEEIEALIHENKVLKECMQGESREIASSVVDILCRKVDYSTREIICAIVQEREDKKQKEKERWAENTRWSSLIGDLFYVKEGTTQVRALFQEIEREISGLAHLATDMSSKIEEKNKHLKMYAVVNQRLSAIRDECIKNKQEKTE